MTRSSLATLVRDDGARLQAALQLDASTARIEVQTLLQQVLQVSRAYLLTYPERQLNVEQQARYLAWLERRLQGEPLAYILGEREFFGLTFKVSPATLIPRADTELLVELALTHIAAATAPSSSVLQKFRVLDLGTGSGAIALSIAHSCPQIEVLAVDASAAALAVAQHNAQRLQLSHVQFLQSDWCAALQDEQFDLIVSNPPYINAADTHLTQGDLRFEPRSALVAGTDGLDDIRRIIPTAQCHLKQGGGLLLEHGYDQAARVRALLHEAGFCEVFSARDLAGIERVSGGVLLA